MTSLVLFPHLHRRLPCRLRDPISKHRDRFLVYRVSVHLLPQDPFDTLKQLDIVLGDQGDGFTRSTCSGSTTDSMDVFLGMSGDIVVDDQVDQGDIETSAGQDDDGSISLQAHFIHGARDDAPRCYIRSDQNLPPSTLELVQSPQPRTLTQLSMQRDRWESE